MASPSRSPSRPLSRSRSPVRVSFVDLPDNVYQNILMETLPSDIENLCKSNLNFYNECQRPIFRKEYIERHFERSEDKKKLENYLDENDDIINLDKVVFYINKDIDKLSSPIFSNLPALASFWGDGTKETERYYLNGKLHRDQKNGPAEIRWDENGIKRDEDYYVNGQNHRDPKDGPATTVWSEGEIKYLEIYYVNGKLHRDPKDGPATTEWYIEVSEQRTGNKRREDYYVNGKLHRDPKDGPAETEWYENGLETWTKWREGYYINGKLHRDPKEGPALTFWYTNGPKIGTKESETYYVDGRKLSSQEVKELLNKKVKTITPIIQGKDGIIHKNLMGKATMSRLELEAKTIKELREMAREKKISLRSKTLKVDIVDILFHESNK